MREGECSWEFEGFESDWWLVCLNRRREDEGDDENELAVGDIVADESSAGGDWSDVDGSVGEGAVKTIFDIFGILGSGSCCDIEGELDSVRGSGGGGDDNLVDGLLDDKARLSFERECLMVRSSSERDFDPRILSLSDSLDILVASEVGVWEDWGDDNDDDGGGGGEVVIVVAVVVDDELLIKIGFSFLGLGFNLSCL